MHLGILRADRVVEPLRDVHGDYPGMFASAFDGVWDGEPLRFSTFDVVGAPPPTDVDLCDAWVITGSSASTYDGHDWIARLEDFLRKLHAARRPVLGICFGHQLVAQALGGRVEKASQGWMVGQHSVRFTTSESWMEPGRSELLLPSSHQDQVVALPPEAVTLGEHPGCPCAAYRLGDHILCLQGHPEFRPAYGRALLEFRRERVGSALADAGLASYATAGDQALAMRWLLAFAEAACARRAAAALSRPASSV